MRQRLFCQLTSDKTGDFFNREHRRSQAHRWVEPSYAVSYYTAAILVKQEREYQAKGAAVRHLLVLCSLQHQRIGDIVCVCFSVFLRMGGLRVCVGRRSYLWARVSSNTRSSPSRVKVHHSYSTFVLRRCRFEWNKEIISVSIIRSSPRSPSPRDLTHTHTRFQCLPSSFLILMSLLIDRVPSQFTPIHSLWCRST